MSEDFNLYEITYSHIEKAIQLPTFRSVYVPGLDEESTINTFNHDIRLKIEEKLGRSISRSREVKKVEVEGYEVIVRPIQESALEQTVS